jgi:hypothetical protein
MISLKGFTLRKKILNDLFEDVFVIGNRMFQLFAYLSGKAVSIGSLFL